MDFSGIQTLAFDLDYTLIDSAEGIVYCFNEARKRAGEGEVEPELIRKRIGIPIDQTFRLYGSPDPKGMREIFRRIAREGAMAKRSFLLPGVTATLPRLKDMGYRLAVNSTKSRPEIESILGHLQVLHLFEAWVGSDEVRDPKPAPDSLILLLERLKLPPAALAYVGDHVVDVRAARAAFVRAIAVKGGPCPFSDLEKETPDILLDSVADLPGLLRRGLQDQ
jgi:phosphoglycolate phosphatase